MHRPVHPQGHPAAPAQAEADEGGPPDPEALAARRLGLVREAGEGGDQAARGGRQAVGLADGAGEGEGGTGLLAQGAGLQEGNAAGQRDGGQLGHPEPEADAVAAQEPEAWQRDGRERPGGGQ